jgi:thiol:disulfide interchange protein
MKKQKKQLIALCILLLICIVAWVGLTKWNKSQEQKKQEEEEASKVTVTDVNTEDVNAFSYQYNNETLSFVKEDDTWYYEADKSISLDQDTMETLIATTAQLTAEQEIKDYEDLSEYGLETPSNTITLTTGDGTTTLLIGNKNDMLSQYYVKTNQSDSIYLAGSAVYTTYQKGIADLTVTESTEESATEQPEETEEADTLQDGDTESTTEIAE